MNQSRLSTRRKKILLGHSLVSLGYVQQEDIALKILWRTCWFYSNIHIFCKASISWTLMVFKLITYIYLVYKWLINLKKPDDKTAVTLIWILMYDNWTNLCFTENNRDICHLWIKQERRKYKLIHKLKISNNVSYAHHILLMTAELNGSQFTRFSF